MEGTDPPPHAPPLGVGDLPEVRGLVPFVQGAVDLSALDPAALAEIRRSRPDLAARLEGRIDAPTAGPVRRLPYQALARPLEGADRERLAAAVRRYAPQVQLVDGPDIDTRATTVYVGRPTG